MIPETTKYCSATTLVYSRCLAVACLAKCTKVRLFCHYCRCFLHCTRMMLCLLGLHDNSSLDAWIRCLVCLTQEMWRSQDTSMA